MLVLDFINVGNGDSILVREMEGERLRFSMLVDCGHDSLERDDHPPVEDPRSCRIFAGDFLRSQGVAHLDILLVTHFHRDHIGGLGRVLETVTVGELLTPYAPPADSGPLDPDGDNGLPKAARNVLRCMDLYAGPLRHPEGAPPCLPVLHHPEAAAAAPAESRRGLRGRRTSGRAAPSLYRLPAEGIHGRCPFHRCGGDPRPGGAGVPHVRPYRAAMRSSLIKKRPPQPPF